MKFHRSVFLLLIVLVLGFTFIAGCGDDDDDDDDETGAAPDDDETGDDDDDDDDDDNNDDNDDDDDDDDDDDTAEPFDWRFLHDEDGGSLVLQGCNFDGSAKGDSGLPNWTREEALSLATDYGFNFARYLIFWYKIEPEPGVYDDVYLAAVAERLDWLHEAGMRVVLDMHQDVWGPGISENWGGSDGAPEWATITDGLPHISFSEIFGGWGYDYLSPAVNRAFDNFWDYEGDHPELQDHFAAMWAHVAETLGDHPAVIGYNPFNEPWQGTDLLRRREFDETKFRDFNQRMINAIREVDTEAWVFYEPCAFGPNQALPSFMGGLVDPREGEKRLAYFPHLYPVWVELLGGYNPEIDPTIGMWGRQRLRESRRDRVPLLSGEWALLRWFGLDDHVLWTDQTARMLEQVSAGWAFWDCNWFFRGLPEEVRDVAAHPYPRRIAGRPLTRSFDTDSSELLVTFRETGVPGPTEIYLGAARHYPAGFTVEVTDPDGAWSSEYDSTLEILTVFTDPAQSEHTIRVTPDER
jgi:endoglycosylceramidase